MLNTARNNQELAWEDGHDPVPELHVEFAGEDQKQLVCLVVLVPDQLPFGLHQPNFIVVVTGDDLGSEVLAKLVKLLSEIDFHRLTLGHWASPQEGSGGQDRHG